MRIYIKDKSEPLEQIKERMSRELAKEMEKKERDEKCGGIDGYGYCRLHDRSWVN